MDVKVREKYNAVKVTGEKDEYETIDLLIAGVEVEREEGVYVQPVIIEKIIVTSQFIGVLNVNPGLNVQPQTDITEFKKQMRGMIKTDKKIKKVEVGKL